MVHRTTGYECSGGPTKFIGGLGSLFVRNVDIAPYPSCSINVLQCTPGGVHGMGYVWNFFCQN